MKNVEKVNGVGDYALDDGSCIFHNQDQSLRRTQEFSSQISGESPEFEVRPKGPAQVQPTEVKRSSYRVVRQAQCRTSAHHGKELLKLFRVEAVEGRDQVRLGTCCDTVAIYEWFVAGDTNQGLTGRLGRATQHVRRDKRSREVRRRR